MNEGHDQVLVAAVVRDVWLELKPAAQRHIGARSDGVRRHRARRVTGVVLAGVALAAGGAAAAQVLVGDAAPPAVQASLGGVDEGLPPDLRLNPDVANARSVAVDGDAVLYAADLPGGGVCTEIATAGRPNGAVCRTSTQPQPAIDATIPGTPEDASGPVVVGGRVNVDADAVALVTSDGRRLAVTMQPDGYYIVELNAADSAAAREGLRIEAAREGSVVASLDVSDAFTSEIGHADPIGLEMVSGSGDLTKVVSIYGTVQDAAAVTVRLIYPDGSTADTPVGAGGRYELTLAPERQGALDTAPGRLVAVDANGKELASRTVAAVSWWERRSRTAQGSQP
jgi:hypothetical protein